MEYLRLLFSQEGGKAFSELTKSLTVVTGSAEGLDLGTAFKSAQEGIAAAAGNVFTALYARYADLDQETQFQFGALLTGQTDVETMVSDLQALTDQLREDDSVQKFPREKPATAATPAA
jgi:N-acetylglucosamine transport system substrate-binding protein